jgi:hypothetical protein
MVYHCVCHCSNPLVMLLAEVMSRLSDSRLDFDTTSADNL